MVVKNFRLPGNDEGIKDYLKKASKGESHCWNYSSYDFEGEVVVVAWSSKDIVSINVGEDVNKSLERLTL